MRICKVFKHLVFLWDLVITSYQLYDKVNPNKRKVKGCIYPLLLYSPTLPYPQLEMVLLKLSFHKEQPPKTRYQILNRRVFSSILMDWHNMEFLFECTIILIWQFLIHSDLLILPLLFCSEIY